MEFDTCMFGCGQFMPNPSPCEYAMPTDPLNNMLIGYSYVPFQKAGKLYCESEALKNGTVFPELNKPLGVYGREFCRRQN